MAQRKPPKGETDRQAYERIDVDELLFDPKNPRLVEYMDSPDPTQEELLGVLWRKMSVDELAMSIAASGYFDYEPLFVVEEKGQVLVIEGNRRLAAVKLLLSKNLRDELRATDLPKVKPTVATGLRQLPVIRTTRKDAWDDRGRRSGTIGDDRGRSGTAP